MKGRWKMIVEEGTKVELLFNGRDAGDAWTAAHYIIPAASVIQLLFDPL